MQLFKEDGTPIDFWDICQYWIEAYPDDIFITEPELVVKIRECAIELLKMKGSYNPDKPVLKVEPEIGEELERLAKKQCANCGREIEGEPRAWNGHTICQQCDNSTNPKKDDAGGKLDAN